MLTVLLLAGSIGVANAGPKEEALQVVEKWSKAFTEADVDTIVRLYADDAIMIGTQGKAVLTTSEQIRNYFDIALNIDRPRTAALNSSVTFIVDDNSAVVAGFDTITGTREGQQTAARGRVTFVIARRGADWKIIHLHRSPMPQS
jgi:uncharacterized protein (TIGR02246 family)